MKRAVGALLILSALIGIWEIYVDTGGADPLLLPPPHAIAQAIYHDRALLWSNFLITAREVLLGLTLAVSGGLALALALHAWRPVRTSVYPLLVASQAVPMPVLVPLLLLWLGFGIGSKVALIGIVSFFSVVVATLDALGSVDPQLIKLMRSFDAPRRRIIRLVELPSALPGLFTGAKIAAAVAVIGSVFAEIAGSNSGLGYLFQISESQLLQARAFATVVILSFFAILLFVLIDLTARLALPWAHQGGSSQ